MNRRLARAIVRALAVSGSPIDRLRALQEFSSSDWRQTLSWLDDHALALYLLDSVAHAGAGAILPPEVQASLSRSLEENRLRLAAMKEEFRLLNGHLDAAGADYAVLKGFALVPDYCPNLMLRSQYDYDYLVSAATANRAQAALEALGYARKIQSPKHEPEGVSLLARQGASAVNPSAGLYSSDLARGVELHTKLWEYNADGVAIETPADLLDHKHDSSWDGLSFPVLADVDALLFQVLHAFHHLLDHWCRLSCFLEIARFLEGHRTDAAFWARFRERVQRLHRVPDAVGLIFALAHTLFDAPVPAEVSHWAVLPPNASLWVQRYGIDWALSPFPGSKRSLFVHRTFVDDDATWRRIRRARLLPWHRPAQVVDEDKSADFRAGSAWKRRAQQWRFVLGRVRFHGLALIKYGWRWPKWNRMTRKAAGSRESASEQAPAQ